MATQLYAHCMTATSIEALDHVCKFPSKAAVIEQVFCALTFINIYSLGLLTQFPHAISLQLPHSKFLSLK